MAAAAATARPSYLWTPEIVQTKQLKDAKVCHLIDSSLSTKRRLNSGTATRVIDAIIHLDEFLIMQNYNCKVMWSDDTLVNDGFFTSEELLTLVESSNDLEKLTTDTDLKEQLDLADVLFFSSDGGFFEKIDKEWEFFSGMSMVVCTIVRPKPDSPSDIDLTVYHQIKCNKLILFWDGENDPYILDNDLTSWDSCEQLSWEDIMEKEVDIFDESPEEGFCPIGQNVFIDTEILFGKKIVPTEMSQLMPVADHIVKLAKEQNQVTELIEWLEMHYHLYKENKLGTRKEGLMRCKAVILNLCDHTDVEKVAKNRKELEEFYEEQQNRLEKYRQKSEVALHFIQVLLNTVDKLNCLEYSFKGTLFPEFYRQIQPLEFRNAYRGYCKISGNNEPLCLMLKAIPKESKQWLTNSIHPFARGRLFRLVSPDLVGYTFSQYLITDRDRERLVTQIPLVSLEYQQNREHLMKRLSKIFNGNRDTLALFYGSLDQSLKFAIKETDRYNGILFMMDQLLNYGLIHDNFGKSGRYLPMKAVIEDVVNRGHLDDETLTSTCSLIRATLLFNLTGPSDDDLLITVRKAFLKKVIDGYLENVISKEGEERRSLRRIVFEDLCERDCWLEYQSIISILGADDYLHLMKEVSSVTDLMDGKQLMSPTVILVLLRTLLGIKKKKPLDETIRTLAKDNPIFAQIMVGQNEFTDEEIKEIKKECGIGMEGKKDELDKLREHFATNFINTYYLLPTYKRVDIRKVAHRETFDCPYGVPLYGTQKLVSWYTSKTLRLLADDEYDDIMDLIEFACHCGKVTMEEFFPSPAYTILLLVTLEADEDMKWEQALLELEKTFPSITTVITCPEAVTKEKALEFASNFVTDPYPDNSPFKVIPPFVTEYGPSVLQDQTGYKFYKPEFYVSLKELTEDISKRRAERFKSGYNAKYIFPDEDSYHCNLHLAILKAVKGYYHNMIMPNRYMVIETLKELYMDGKGNLHDPDLIKNIVYGLYSFLTLREQMKFSNKRFVSVSLEKKVLKELEFYGIEPVIDTIDLTGIEIPPMAPIPIEEIPEMLMEELIEPLTEAEVKKTCYTRLYYKGVL